MEVIRKKISLDSCRSHKKGLLPFVDGEIKTDIPNIVNEDGSLTYPNYNYGQFVCDLKIDGKVIKYLDIINAYNFIINKIMSGFFGYGIIDGKRFIVTECKEKPLNCVDNNCTCYDDFQKEEEKEEYIDYVINKFKVLNINDFVNINEKSFEKKLEHEENGCYVLVENFDEIKKLEVKFSTLIFGKECNESFIKCVRENFLKKNIKTKEFNIGEKKIELVVPTVDVHIFLDNEVKNDTIYYPYEYSYNEDDETIEELISENKKTEKELENVNFEVESKLDTLFHFSAIELNEEIFGIPVSCYTMYACQFNNNKWGISAVTDTKNFKCKNGEKLRAGTKEYHNIPFLNCLNYMNDYKDGGTYYFSVRYKNDINKPIRMPFVANDDLNITTYPDGIETCDFISAITPYNESSAEIIYVIGAERNKKDSTGIVYKEVLNYSKVNKRTFVDGFEVDLWYEYLDYDTNIKSIYNTEYNMDCNVRMANIIKMIRGEVWKNGLYVDVPLFTKEISDSLTTMPKIDVDITFNRGNAAGWEKYFKLSECNTMKDLENYGNNFFNL